MSSSGPTAIESYDEALSALPGDTSDSFELTPALTVGLDSLRLAGLDSLRYAGDSHRPVIASAY